MKPRRFEIHRRDMDGHDGAVDIAVDLEHAPAALGRSFAEAKALVVADVRALLAEAEALEEPTP